MKKLGFGLMRLPHTDPADLSTIEVDQVKEMVDCFMGHGFTYFDTAWMYGGFKSETVAKEALVERYPRDSFTLATKLHTGFLKTREDRDRIFAEQLEKTGAGSFDYYLLHGIDGESYAKFEDLDCFAWLVAKKEQGLVKHAGFSFHGDAELLRTVLSAHPEMEFVQLQINYLDWESEWVQGRACYEACVQHGKPVIVMEPVKGGSLASVPPEVEALFKQAEPTWSPASWAIRFAASLPDVMVVLSGMSSLEQVEENVSFMEGFKPLTESQWDICLKAAEIINGQTAVSCTGCAYCVESCPQRIPIPQYFSLHNDLARENMELKGWTVAFPLYDALAARTNKASACIGCGLCERICPQHLPIVSSLRDVSAHFDDREG